MNTPDKHPSTAMLTVSDDRRIRIRGVLSFETVPALMEEAEHLLSKMDNVLVNFGGVEDSNSAGLALLFEMARTMKLSNKSIDFEELPEQMVIVAQAYGIDSELDTYLKP